MIKPSLKNQDIIDNLRNVYRDNFPKKIKFKNV